MLSYLCSFIPLLFALVLALVVSHFWRAGEIKKGDRLLKVVFVLLGIQYIFLLIKGDLND